ncbi:MAG: hypothetical protein RTU09_07910 [Candidatus Thorarchaeota archaeon]
MLRDPDLEKLAVASRQRLTQEFEDKFANLRERVRRVPIEEARRIAEEFSCPLEVAMMAYLIHMDGIQSLRQAITLLSTELQRRASIGEDVPNIPGNIMEFAITEGRWIEYVYGTFARDLELKVRDLANLESTLDEESSTVEKAISVITARTKLAEGFIVPVLQAWLKEHLKSTSQEALLYFGPPVTKWKPETLKGKLLHLRRRNQALFRKLREILSTASESATVDMSITRLDFLINDMDNQLSVMTVKSIAHIILHMAPRPTGRGDRSRYVQVGTASTRGSKSEPDMASPFDFLERDVRLARRRVGEEQSTFLMERIDRVIRVLKFKGDPIHDIVKICLSELIDRLGIENVSLEEQYESAERALVDAEIPERDAVAVKLVFDFVNTNYLSE